MVYGLAVSLSDTVRDHLSVIVDSKLHFDSHISAIVHTAHSCANLILKCFHLRDKELLIKAFCTYVRPLLEYCTPVKWTPRFNYLIGKIEQVQRHFTKCLAGLNKMSYSERLQVLGLPSFECRHLNYSVSTKNVPTKYNGAVFEILGKHH